MKEKKQRKTDSSTSKKKSKLKWNLKGREEKKTRVDKSNQTKMDNPWSVLKSLPMKIVHEKRLIDNKKKETLIAHLVE